MARLSRLESRERTRALILDAARAVVSEMGYDGASISDIALRAGFSKGAFFSNFDSKEALLIEVLRIDKEQELTMLKMVLEGLSDAEAVLALDQYIDGLSGNRACAVLDVEMQLHAARSPEFANIYEQLADTTRKSLGQLINLLFARAGKVAPLPLDELAELFLSLFQGLIVRRVDNPGHCIRLVLNSLVDTAAKVKPDEPSK
ncbi:MAG: TetR/AcrR family transcriptional regulator [Rubrivivax sp.]|nr:MAG: TetR/AcrR family transcriptional regulator [Rubrivivax sp.]